MSVKQKELVPKRRFKGFNGNLQTYTLSEITDIYDGTHQTPKYAEEGVMFLSVEDIKTLKSNKFISQEEFQKDFKNYPEKNDVLMTRIGSIGIANVVQTDQKLAYYVSLALLKTKNVSPKYLVASISSPSVQKELWKRTLHIAFPKKINKNEIENVQINLPSYSEQQKIGQFFKHLDEMITLEQRKIDKTKALKSAYLAEMFPAEGERVPKRRFEGFTDEWRQLKLIDFVDKAVDNRGKTPPLNINGSHPLIEVASLGNGSPDYSKIEKRLDDYSFRNNLRDYIKENDILFSTVGRIGLVSLMDQNEDAAIAQNIVAFRTKINYVPEYIYALFSTKESKFKANSIVMGAVQPSIKVSQLIHIKYSLTTNKKEQEKIGQFFKNLDEMIATHEQKLAKLKATKQAYLHEMFV